MVHLLATADVASWWFGVFVAVVGVSVLSKQIVPPLPSSGPTRWLWRLIPVLGPCWPSVPYGLCVTGFPT